MTDAGKSPGPAGPGISTFEEVAESLPEDYRSVLTPKETMEAVFAIEMYMENHLCRDLNLKMVQVPLIVTRGGGFNDLLDSDGSHTLVEFPCGMGIDPPLPARGVQAAAKRKRPALAQFDCRTGEGIRTHMRAVRKSRFLTGITALLWTRGTVTSPGLGSLSYAVADESRV